MLQNNGGPTETHALLPGSPAIDTGHPSNCPATDQRGETRPNDYTGVARCDIGAFEIQGQESEHAGRFAGRRAPVTFGATMVTMTRTVGSTDPLTTTVTRSDTAPGGGPPDSGEMAVTWSISAAVDSGLDVDVAFCYVDAELDGLVEADLSAYRDGGSGWQDMGGIVDAANNCVLVESVAAFSDWTLATSPPTVAIGDVTGTARYVGSHPGALTMEIGLHADPGDPPLYSQTLAVPGGAYSFVGVSNGDYYASAFIDLDGSGGPPDSYDLLVFYDADGDGTPDPFTVNNNVVSGIDIWVADQYLGPEAAWQATASNEPAISSAGDVNGDGYDDLLIGIRADDAVYLWYGAADGLGPAGTAANADWTAAGDAGSGFGEAVAAAGDLNGDGYDDIAVGAPNANSAAGAVYVWYGGAGGLGATGTVANADWSAAGGQGDDVLGRQPGRSRRCRQRHLRRPAHWRALLQRRGGHGRGRLPLPGRRCRSGRSRDAGQRRLGGHEQPGGRLPGDDALRRRQRQRRRLCRHPDRGAALQQRGDRRGLGADLPRRRGGAGRSRHAGQRRLARGGERCVCGVGIGRDTGR